MMVARLEVDCRKSKKVGVKAEPVLERVKGSSPRWGEGQRNPLQPWRILNNKRGYIVWELL